MSGRVAVGIIAQQRLLNHHITAAGRRRPADVVAWMGAVQAQEYQAATWGLGLRMRDGAAVDEVDGAFARGRILRTHVLRPTWHFVAPADIRWLLELTAPGVHRRMAPYNRQLGLDAATLTRATGVIERALRDKRHLTRPELGDALRRARLAMDPIRLAHAAMHAELEGVICSGPRRGRQFTYALLAERAPTAVRLPREEALAELTRRYFRSHGPATIRDFVWWSGLATADARRGLEMNQPVRQVVNGLTYWSVAGDAGSATRDGTALLPVYDEYLVAYRDREAVPHGPVTMGFGSARTVTFQHALLVAGQVAGTWRPVRNARVRSIEIAPLRRLTRAERQALSDATARYGRFLGSAVSVSLT